jgi:hypothetical protein
VREHPVGEVFVREPNEGSERQSRSGDAASPRPCAADYLTLVDGVDDNVFLVDRVDDEAFHSR